jgi:membrane protein DedA with SNARE-associated domain
MLPFDIDVAGLVKAYGYVAVGCIVAVESLGIPVPGEWALVVAAAYAGTTHDLRIDGIVVAATVGAFVGGNCGYWVGRKFGFPLLKRFGRYVLLDEGRLKVAQYMFQNHGGKVVFFGRFVALLRAFASLLAGANGMGWRHFLVINALGGLVWAAFFGTIAYSLGPRAYGLITKFGLLALFAGVVVLIASLVFFHRHEKLLLEKVERMYPGPLRLPARRPSPRGGGRENRRDQSGPR